MYSFNGFTEECKNTTLSVRTVLEASSSTDLTPVYLDSACLVINHTMVFRKLKHLSNVLASHEVRSFLTENTDFVDVDTLTSVHQVEPHALGESAEETVEVRQCVSFVFNSEFRVLVIPH